MLKPTAPQSSTPGAIYRIGLAIAGGLFIHLAAITAGNVPPTNALPAVAALLVFGAAGFFMLLSAGLRHPPHYLRWLILAAYVMQVITQAALWIQTSGSADPNLVDSGSYTDFAGALIGHGQNPYTWDFGGIFDIRRSHHSSSTPLLNGASERPYPYPALPFLLVVPFQAAGLPGVFSVSILAHIAVLGVAFAAAPRQWQPLILLPSLAGFDFEILTVIGNLDILWALALIGVVVTWRHSVLRAIFYGIAISLKQSPILLAPFLLIRLWYEEGQHRSYPHIARFVLTSGAIFALFNGPFILWNPPAWFEGYTAPVREALVILSHGGVAALTQSGMLYLPKTYFLIAGLAILGLLLFIYSRHHDRLRDALWIMPGIVMWFSFRALVSYWAYWAFPMILAVVRYKPSVKLADRQPSWKLTLAVMAGAISGLLAAGVLLASSTAPVELSLRLPMFAHQGAIDRLVLEVANHGNHILTPRFSVQSRRTSTNPLPWYIEDGPLALQPGETAIYTITSSRSDRTFYGHEPVQLVVTDAGGDYSLRGVLTIESDPAYLWPDMIPNADYRMWDAEWESPFSWQVSSLGSASFVRLDGREALRLAPRAGPDGMKEISAATRVLFPDAQFGIWLFPPEGDSSAAYGLEFDDGERRLRILFGPKAYTGPREDGIHILHRTAPAGMWSFHEIDLQAAYAETGWPDPDLRRVFYRGLEMDAQVIELRLFFSAARTSVQDAFFGPIIDNLDHPTPESLMAGVLGNPAAYYIRLGQAYEAEGSPSRAVEAYQRALDFSPANSEVRARIEILLRQLDGEGQ